MGLRLYPAIDGFYVVHALTIGFWRSVRGDLQILLACKPGNFSSAVDRSRFKSSGNNKHLFCNPVIGYQLNDIRHGRISCFPAHARKSPARWIWSSPAEFNQAGGDRAGQLVVNI